ncbi:MAG: GMC oxidoreductase, partial [Acidimicrobiales bacterium]
MSRPRAVVVGSGPAGATVARLLARSGAYDVVVMEKGLNYFTGLGGDPAKVSNVFANDEIAYESSSVAPFDQDPLLEPRSFRTDPSAGPRSFVGDVDDLAVTVGGTYVHADVKARRLREVDFITNSLMGGTADRPAIPETTYADWPMTYCHLEPFYAVIEEIEGIQGPAHRTASGAIYNPNPYESPRSTPFPLPPGVQQLNSLLPAESASRLGYHPAPVPTAIVSRPYRGRPACVDCGFCLDFGCPSNAKSGGVWLLNDALAAGATLLTQANVVRVEFDKGPGGRYRANGVTYIDAEGRSRSLKADLVVLANTPIEATRISLLSGISQAPDETSLSTLRPSPTEPSGLLGRNLMFHLQSAMIALVNLDIHSWRGRTSTQCLDAFAGSGPSPAQFDPTVPMGGILEIGGNLNPIQEATEVASFAYGARHKAYMQLSPFRKHLTTFTMQGQDMPQLTNYVDLDPDIVDVWGQPVPRITYRNHPYELAAAAYYVPKMLEIMENIGGPGSAYPNVRTLFAASIDPTLPSVVPGSADNGLSPVTGQLPFSDIPQDKHIMGTHRMALDPAHGPCDPYGRYWAFENLYHAGGGLFATAPGYNPTVTIYALSYWLGAAIVAGVGQRASYSARDIDGAWPRLVEVIVKLDSDTMAAKAIRQGTLTCQPGAAAGAASGSGASATGGGMNPNGPGSVGGPGSSTRSGPGADSRSGSVGGSGPSALAVTGAASAALVALAAVATASGLSLTELARQRSDAAN